MPCRWAYGVWKSHTDLEGWKTKTQAPHLNVLLIHNHTKEAYAKKSYIRFWYYFLCGSPNIQCKPFCAHS